ncbi:MAG: hydroxymethylglutaryl-CoA lyase [Vicinamibacterales bacterium]
MQEPVIHEVGMRDGLQIEKAVVPTEQKMAWIEALATSGVDMIQVGSFVHKEKVPQMADTDELFGLLAGREYPGVTFTALVLNEKGLERGLACGVTSFCIGASASDTHSRKNTGMGTEEATGRVVAMARAAKAAGAYVQMTVQSAFGCGYEGAVPEERVLGMVRRYVEEGVNTVSLADTAGHATPDQVLRLFAAVREMDPKVEMACHLHDTYGMGLANAWAAMSAGVKYFETAFGGLGGCPFTKISGGNICTEDFVHMLQRTGRRKDIKLDRLIELTRDVGRFLGRDMAGRIWRTGPIAV